MDRTGAAQPLQAVPTGPYLFPRLSPDGTRIAAIVRRGPPDIWAYDVLRGAPTRLTFDGNASAPVWSPDGKRLVYAARTGGVSNLHAIDAGGGGKPERLTTSEFAQTPSSWSSTANAIAFVQRPQSGASGIWALPMTGDRTPALWLESRFTLAFPEFSPDGRWIAYVSNESGAFEVYVHAYPGPGEKIRISTSGGMEPIWSPKGRELLYRHNEQFFSVAIQSLSPFRAEAPRLLFAAKPGEYDSTSPARSWDVSADGRRFLLQRYSASTDKPVTAMHVVLNWAGELKRLAPAK